MSLPLRLLSLRQLKTHRALLVTLQTQRIAVLLRPAVGLVQADTEAGFGADGVLKNFGDDFCRNWIAVVANCESLTMAAAN